MSHEILNPKEIESRGEEIFRQKISQLTTEADHGKFVVIDVVSGDYELDTDHLAASLRLLSRRGRGDHFYSIRIGHRAAYRMGGHFMPRIL